MLTRVYPEYKVAGKNALRKIDHRAESIEHMQGRRELIQQTKIWSQNDTDMVFETSRG